MKNKLILSVLGIAIGIILVGSVLMPVLEDAQRTAGPRHTFDNPSSYTPQLGLSSETHEFDLNSTGAYFDGDLISSAGIMVISSSVVINVTSGSDWNTLLATPDKSESYRPSWGSQVNVKFEDGTVTITGKTGDVLTYSYDWVYTIMEGGDFKEYTSNTPVYVNSINDVVCAGYYNSGENDTGYALFNGQVSLTNPAYSGKVTYTLTKVDGYTDVYRLSDLTIFVDDETYHPYYWIAKSTIVGHEEAPQLSSLYGVIPVMILVAILVSAVMIVRTRD